MDKHLTDIARINHLLWTRHLPETKQKLLLNFRKLSN